MVHRLASVSEGKHQSIKTSEFDPFDRSTTGIRRLNVSPLSRRGLHRFCYFPGSTLLFGILSDVKIRSSSKRPLLLWRNRKSMGWCCLLLEASEVLWTWNVIGYESHTSRTSCWQEGAGLEPTVKGHLRLDARKSRRFHYEIGFRTSNHLQGPHADYQGLRCNGTCK